MYVNSSFVLYNTILFSMAEPISERTTSSYTLKEIPADVYQFVQRQQAAIKEKRGTNQYSFECTIYKMLRDLKRCQEANPDFKTEDAA